MARTPSPKQTIRGTLALIAAVLTAFGLWLGAAGAQSAATITADTAAHFIDVGQGDCALLVSGDQAILIDAGVPAAADTVLSYLDAQQIDTLYAVIATHPHADHIGGMAAVIDAIEIQNFYMGPEVANTEVYAQMLDALEARSLHPQIPQDGDTLPLDSGAVLEFLGPADDVSASNVNNRSILCRFSANGKSVLLMGDAEQAAEASLLAHHPFLTCDILKVGHHGSDTASSDAFLRGLDASVAVISCGADNDYGHPHQAALDRLAAAGIQDIRITAEEGTIVLPLAA